MLNIGNLDRLVTIERFTETKNEHHTPVSAWTEFVTLWAEVLQHVADEGEAGMGEAQTDTLMFRTRYFAGVTTADRLVFEGRVFNLKGITEIGRRDALELRAVATA